VSTPRQPYVVRFGAALVAIGLLSLIFYVADSSDAGRLAVGLPAVVVGALLATIGLRRTTSAT
jgi:hypothetical protein